MFILIKALVLTSILVPLFKTKMLFEYLVTVLIMLTPLAWSSWDLPKVFTLSLMADKLSIALIMLSIWTSILMLLLSGSSDKFMSLNIILLLVSLLAFFSTSDLLVFFVTFEASLIPTLLLILGWGYQPERLEASYYFIFYTIAVSTPLLVSLIWLISASGNKYFYFDSLYNICSGVMGILVLLVFLIKLPLFMTHFWLPKAHVQAPVVGSMVLAGVLLKTGGYGVVRVYTYMQKTLLSSGFKMLSLLGMVHVCLICLCCTDLKQLIAYSSVSHMNFMLVGLMTNSLVSYDGGVIMMVSHGLCSSLMFMLADLSYKRCMSRSILVNKGFLVVAPILSLLWGLTVLFNMGVPPTAGCLSELMIITSSPKILIFYLGFGLYLFLSAFYSVYLYMVINHGNSGKASYTLSVKEVLMSVAHLTPLASLTFGSALLLL